MRGRLQGRKGWKTGQHNKKRKKKKENLKTANRGKSRKITIASRKTSLV